MPRRGSRTSRAPGVVVTVSGPPTEPLQPLDDYAQKVLRSRRRGTVYPYELVPLLDPATGGTFVEHDLDDDGRAGAGRPPAGRQHGRARRRAWSRTPTQRYPEGMTPRRPARRPDEGAGRGRRAGVRAGSCAALDLAEELRRAGRVVRAVRRARGSRWTPAPRTWTGSPRALRRIIEFTQDGGEINVVVDRDQRRRPAVLERRGDDAHAHQGHPGHDAGQRDGAHRQAVARLLRRRLGRGQLRHRRLRPGDGPERAGAVLGARPGRRACDVLFAHYEHAYVAPGRAVPAAGADDRPASTATSATTRTPSPDSDFTHRRGHLLRRRPTPSARSRSTSAR